MKWSYSYFCADLDRPLGLRDVKYSRIYRHSEHESNKVVSPTHGPSLPPGDISYTHFSQKLSWTQDHSQARRIKSNKKIPMTEPEIEPATFRLVAHCLKQTRHNVT